MLRLCIPVHNEAPTIGVLLWRIRKVFQEFSREYDVTVFDDASSDGTGELLEPYRAVMPLTILSAPRRVGYARAVDALVRHVAADDEYARRDAMVLLQGDFTDQPEQLPELVKRFEGGADVVAVARPVGDAAMPADERRLRRWGTWAVRPFLRLPPFDDPFGSYRLVRIAVLRDLLRASAGEPVCRGDDPWAVNADFALNLAPFARRIENVPLPGRYDVRPRPSRHRAWPDTLMLFRWARGARRLVRPVPKPAGKGEARERGAEIVRHAGADYAASSAPPPPRPPRPTREELAASEAPSRRARRPVLPIEAVAVEPAAAPAQAERRERGERGERGERAERTERGTRAEPGDRRRDQPGERPARPEPRGEPRREKGARPARGERPPRPATAAAAEAGVAAPDHHRHLRAVAKHPHHDTTAPAGAPADGVVEPLEPTPVLAGPLAAQGDDASAPDALVVDGGATKKKRRRRRKKRGAAADGSPSSGADDAADVGDMDGADDADDAGDADTAGDVRRARVARAAADPGDADAPRDGGDAGDDGDEDIDDGPDAGDGALDGAAAPRKRRRPRRRRRRPRSPGAGDGVVEGGVGDASSPVAPASGPPPGPDA